MNKLEIVPQEDDFGCSVACVASVTNKNYQDAKKLFSHPENAESGGFSCKAVVEALARAGLKYRFCYAKNGNNRLLERRGTIVFFPRDRRWPGGHYMINIQGGWMNSWANFPETPASADVEEQLPGRPEWIIYSGNNRL